MKHHKSSSLFIIIALLLSATATAQQTFDPGHDDITIQPIGTSIKRCQFSDKSEFVKTSGYDVPAWVDSPQVTFEQYRMGDAENGPVCTVPMLRGGRDNSAGVSVPFVCFFEMNCTS